MFGTFEGSDANHPFYEIENGDTLIGYSGEEKTAVIPDGIKYIACKAFYYAPIEEVVFPKGILAIESFAFQSCKNLKSIDVPLSVIYIGQDAFEGCTSLERAVIPANAISGDRAGSYRPKSGMFYDCKNLRKLRFEGIFDPPNTSDPPSYTEHKIIRPNAVPITIYRNGRFLGAVSPHALDGTALQSITATGVPYSAVQKEWQSLALVGFIEAYMSGETVDPSIAEGYFSAMAKRKGHIQEYINRPLIMDYFIRQKLIGLNRIDELTELAAGEGHTEVAALLLNYKNKAFTSDEITKYRQKEQKKLEKEMDVLPEKTPRANKKPVDKTSDAYMKKTWAVNEGRGKFYISRYKGEDTAVVFPESVLGNSISGISNRSGKITSSYEDLETVILPDGYKTIGNHAFDGCNKLREITIPMTVNQIGEAAFNQCSSLRTVILPPQAMVGKWAFRDCFSLKDVYVLNTKETFKGNASFRGTTGCTYHILEGSRAHQEGMKKSVLITNDDIRMIAEYYFAAPLIRTVYFSSKDDVSVTPGDELTFGKLGERDFGSTVIDKNGRILGVVVEPEATSYDAIPGLYLYNEYITGVVASEVEDLQWTKSFRIIISLI